MPVRNVSNRGGNVIGSFPSVKMGRMVAFESLLERDYLYLLDYDPDVAWFEEQPLTIEYQHEGKVLHYTPDFHLLERGRDVLVECKPVRFTHTDENQRKFAVAQLWCDQRRWEFRVVTEQQVRGGVRLENIKLLASYARQSVDPVLQGRIYAFLHDVSAPPTITALASTLVPDATALAVVRILHLAFHHQVCIPLDDVPLTGDAPVYLPIRMRKEHRA